MDIIDTKPFYTLDEQRGRDSMKRDILRLFSPELLARDLSLQKLAKAIEEIE